MKGMAEYRDRLQEYLFSEIPWRPAVPANNNLIHEDPGSSQDLQALGIRTGFPCRY